ATLLVRIMMTLWMRRYRPKTLKVSFVRFVPDKTNFKFMNGRFWGIGLSVALSLASVVLFFTPGLNYGIDFKGGIQIEIKTPAQPNEEALRTDLNKLGLGQVGIQRISAPQPGTPDEVLVRLEQQAGGDEAQQ